MDQFSMYSNSLEQLVTVTQYRSIDKDETLWQITPDQFGMGLSSTMSSVSIGKPGG